MLRSAKQLGQDCLAFALYNAGMIELEAREDYTARMLYAEAQCRALLPVPPIDTPPVELIVGTKEFAKPWADKWKIRGLYEIMARLDRGMPATGLSFPEGRGVLFIRIERHNTASSYHAVAFEDGTVVDSGGYAQSQTPISWEAYKACMHNKELAVSIANVLHAETVTL